MPGLPWPSATPPRVIAIVPAVPTVLPLALFVQPAYICRIELGRPHHAPGQFALPLAANLWIY